MSGYPGGHDPRRGGYPGSGSGAGGGSHPPPHNNSNNHGSWSQGPNGAPNLQIVQQLLQLHHQQQQQHNAHPNASGSYGGPAYPPMNAQSNYNPTSGSSGGGPPSRYAPSTPYDPSRPAPDTAGLNLSDPRTLEVFQQAQKLLQQQSHAQPPSANAMAGYYGAPPPSTSSSGPTAYGNSGPPPSRYSPSRAYPPPRDRDGAGGPPPPRGREPPPSHGRDRDAPPHGREGGGGGPPSHRDPRTSYHPGGYEAASAPPPRSGYNSGPPPPYGGGGPGKDSDRPFLPPEARAPYGSGSAYPLPRREERGSPPRSHPRDSPPRRGPPPSSHERGRGGPRGGPSSSSDRGRGLNKRGSGHSYSAPPPAPSRTGPPPDRRESGPGDGRGRGGKRGSFHERGGPTNRTLRRTPSREEGPHGSSLPRPSPRASPLKRKRSVSPPPVARTTSSLRHDTPARASPENDKGPTVFPFHAFDSTHLNYLEVRERYRKMNVPKDFAAARVLWPEQHGAALATLIPQHYFLDFSYTTALEPSSDIKKQMGMEEEGVVLTGDSQGSDQCYYTAKVLLYAGQRKKSKRRGFSAATYAHHFVVGRQEGNELFCIGGPWSRTHDGSDPATDRHVLERTAERHLKAFTGLDLASLPRACRWMHFVDIRYQRPTGVEVCAILLPCLWEVSLSHLQVVSPSNPLSLSPERESTEASSTHSTSAGTCSASSGGKTGEGDNEVVMEMEIDSPSHDDMAVLDSPTPTSSLENTPVHPASLEAFPSSSLMGDGPSSSSTSSNPTPTSKSTGGEGNSTTSSTTTTTSSSSTTTTTTTTGTIGGGGESEVESDRILLVTPVTQRKSKFKARNLSLGGLLEYDRSDVGERLFEVSLVGELFSDMLKAHYATVIRAALETYRHNRSQLLLSHHHHHHHPPPSKKPKLAHDDDGEGTDHGDDGDDNDNDNDNDSAAGNDSAGTVPASSDPTTAAASTSSTKEDSSQENNKNNKNNKNKKNTKGGEGDLGKKKNSGPTAGPPSLLQIAFEFFDVRQKGIFRPEEMEEILYRLGRQSSARVVEELVDPLIGVNSGRICYTHLLQDGTL